MALSDGIALTRLRDLHRRVEEAGAAAIAEVPYDALQFAITADLGEIFGPKSDEVVLLKGAAELVYFTQKPKEWFGQQRVLNLRKQAILLAEIVGRFERRTKEGPPAASEDGSAASLGKIDLLLSRFHRVARAMQGRHDERATLEVNDEYDVQDLLGALLAIHFDDVRLEETTPSYAGGSSRMDFLLKDEQIVIETKMTRKGLGAKEVGSQLLIDIARYRSHPDCRTLVCFVYDPTGLIKNAAGLERDLSREHDGMKVSVLIAPKDY